MVVWSGSPSFPNTLGAWYPLRLFSVAQQLEMTPQVALAILGNIAVANGVQITPSTDLNVLFGLQLTRYNTMSSVTSLNSTLMIDLSSDWDFGSDIWLSTGDDLEFESQIEMIGESTLTLLSRLAVQQGLLTESGGELKFIGPEAVSLVLAASPSSGLTSLAALEVGLGLSSAAASGIRLSALINLGHPIAALMATDLRKTSVVQFDSTSIQFGSTVDIEVINPVPIYRMYKTNTTNGSGTSWNDLTGFVNDPAYPGPAIISGSTLRIPNGIQPYNATVAAEVPQSGGTVPRYGQTRILKNGTVVHEGPQQTSSGATSRAQWDGPLQGLDELKIQWRGEGNFFNRPTAQAGAWLQITPQD